MKKTLCVFLSIVLLIACLLPSYAYDECDCGNTPLVFITGMNTSPLYLNYGTEIEKQIFTPDPDDIKKTVGQVVIPLYGIIKNHDWESFGDVFTSAINALFEYTKCNPDGTSKYDVFSFSYDGSAATDDRSGVLSSTGALGIKAAQAVGDDHVYAFVYDWRLDPMEHAKELDEFVQNVKSETNHEKVSFISTSMGGIVTMAYLQQFGSDDLDNLVMVSSAFCGVEMIGDVLTGRFDFDVDAILRFVCQYIEMSPFGNVINYLLETMNEADMLDGLQQLFDEFLIHCGDQFINDAIKPIFSRMPSVWGLIPAKDYNEAKALMLDESENSALIEKIDNYYYNVKLNVENIINNAISNGVNFSVVSNYNLQGVPVGEGRNLQNDTVIDTIYTSAGATCALLGETLGDDYVQAVDCGHNHLSPDGIIDASTCKWPEQTWFVKNMMHIGRTTRGNNTQLYIWLATSDEQCYVYSNGNYPQFLEFDYVSGNISPLK